MATIDLELHLDIDEIIERLRAEGWVIPVRCKDCGHYKAKSAGAAIYFVCENAGHYTDTDFFEPPSGDWFCADGERKGGGE